MLDDYNYRNVPDDNEYRGQWIIGFLADVLTPLDNMIEEKLDEVNKWRDRCFQGSTARLVCAAYVLAITHGMLGSALLERNDEPLWMFVACRFCCIFIGVLFNKFKRHHEKKPGDRELLFSINLLACVVIAELMDCIDVAGLFTFDELDVFALILLMPTVCASAYAFVDTPESKGDDNDSRFCMPPDRQLPEITGADEKAAINAKASTGVSERV